MTLLAPLPSPAFALPAIIAEAEPGAQMRFLEFFTATIRNVHTRRSYGRGCADFLDWCAERGVTALPQIQPLHVAAWVEELGREVSVPTVKQRLAGVRHLIRLAGPDPGGGAEPGRVGARPRP